ncbi:hypothetical protein [Denitrobaculum tricleocarpae]|nr:hypothetical protein [Denitrobaculum tricleocarpae]
MDEPVRKRIERPAYEYGLLFVIVASVAIFYVLTLQPNIMWSGGTDTFNYILSGLKILDSWGYLERVLSEAHLGMREDLEVVFPALSSLQIALVYQLSNGNFWISKLPGVVCFLAALPLIYRLSRNQVGLLCSVLIIITIGLSPYFFSFKEEIRSDLQFFFLLFLAMVLFMEMDQDGERRKIHFLIAMLCGVVCYLSIGYRSVGLALFPAIVAYDIWRHKKLRLVSLLTLAVGIGLYVLQSKLVPSGDGRYASSFPTDLSVYLERVYTNVVQYHYNIQRFVENTVFSAFTWVAYLSLLGLVAIGYLSRLFGRATILEFFIVVYFAGLLISPTTSAWQRYLIPAYPLILYYAFAGINFCSTVLNLGERIRKFGVVALSALIIANFGTQYLTRVPFHTLDEGPTSTSALAMYDFLSTSVKPGEVVATGFPAITGVVRLQTGLRAANLLEVDADLSEQEFDRILWQHFRDRGVRTLVLRHSEPRMVASYFGTRDIVDVNRLHIAFAERHKESVSAVFRNADFVVYRIGSEPS